MLSEDTMYATDWLGLFDACQLGRACHTYHSLSPGGGSLQPSVGMCWHGQHVSQYGTKSGLPERRRRHQPSVCGTSKVYSNVQDEPTALFSTQFGHV